MRDRDPERPVDPNHRAYLEADQSWQDGDQQWRIKIVHPFWDSIAQELEYLAAVEETRGMKPSERLEEIRQRFSKGTVLKPMPYPRQTRRERDAELAKLRAQVDEGEEDWWQR